MRGRVAEVVAVAALAACITLVLAAPVLRAPSERVFGAESVGRYHDPFTTMWRFEQPFGAGGVHEQPVTDLAGALLARLAGPVAAYNWLVLLTFPLAAAAAYLLARHLELSPAGASVAAMAYAFSPFHLAHAAYHPHIAQTQWLPLYLLALFRCLDRATPGAIGFLAAATAAVTLSNFYGGLIAAVLTPVAVAVYWLSIRHRGSRSTRRLGITLITLALLAAAGLAYVSYFAREMVVARASFAFPRADLFLYSAKWWSYLVPPVVSPLFGGAAHRLWDAVGLGDERLEQQVSLGWGIVALGLVAVYWWLRREREPATRTHVPLLVAVAGAALLCSLSPERQIGVIPFVRPSALFYELAPMFRAYARFGVVVQLMAALLAGVGVDRLRRSGARGAQLLCLTLVALAAVEYAASPAALWRDTLPTSAHRWIARQPEAMTVLDCVRLEPASAAVEGWLTGSRVSVPGGPLADCAEPGLPAKLAALGYTHVLARRGSWESRWLAEREGLAIAEHFDDADLLAVTAAPPAVYTASTTGLFAVEHREGTTWRWMGDHGSWRVVNRSGGPISAAVEIELWAFGGVRQLELLLDRREAQMLVVEEPPRSYRIGPFELSPGEHELAFRPIEPAAVADDLLRNGDLRALTIALGSWQWVVLEHLP